MAEHPDDDDPAELSDDLSEEWLRCERESRRLTNPFEYLGQPRMGLSLTWMGLALTAELNKGLLKRGHTYNRIILESISGQAWRGELVAVLGDGFAGKSTFFHLLSGRQIDGRPSGEVQASGKPRDQDWYRRSCLVPPHSPFHEWLTVRETVVQAAALKLPAKMSWALKAENVDKILDICQLTEVKDVLLRDLPDGGRSGGENSRLALAVELVTDPEVVFFDHDLVSLSLEATRRMVEALRDLALLDGRIVFLSISETSRPLLDLVDKVLVLSHGHALYYGTLRYAYRHFRRLGYGQPANRAQAAFLIGIGQVDLTRRSSRETCQRRIDLLAQAWKDLSGRRRIFRPSRPKTLHVYASDTESAQQPRQDPIRWTQSGWEEFRVLLRRESLIRFRNRRNLILTIIQLLALALLTGFVFFQLPDRGETDWILGRDILLGFIPKMQYFFYMFPLINALLTSRPIVKRERGAHSYRPVSQYAASVIASIPLRLFFNLIYGTIVYYLTGLRTDGFQWFVAYQGILAVSLLAAIGLSYLCCSLTGRPGHASIFVPIILIVSFTFSGGRPESSWVLRWIQYTLPTIFAVTGLKRVEFDGQPGVLELLGYASPSLAWCYGALLIQTAVYLVAAYLLEECHTRPKFRLF